MSVPGDAHVSALREGTADDVCFFVDADRLSSPGRARAAAAVQEAWADWIERRRLAAQVLSPLPGSSAPQSALTGRAQIFSVNAFVSYPV